MTTAPLMIRSHEQRLLVIGPGDALRPALSGAAPVTLGGKYAGEIIWLASRTTRTWRADAISLDVESIHEIRQHPQFGEVVRVWVDEDRLDQAPKLAAALHAAHLKAGAARMAAERERRANDPACGYCGDCAECC